MATQYTAGLALGQKLTADIMNQIGAAWETWTPTITASSGTFTTVTTNNARYTRIQKLIIGVLDITITAIGTGAGQVIITRPITALAGLAPDGGQGFWREQALSGETGVFTWSTTTTMRMARYDNGVYLNNGDRYMGYFIYEAA